MDFPLLSAQLGNAIQLGRLLLQERDRQKAAAIQIELTEKILQAQAQLIEVRAAVVNKDAAMQALRERITELEAAQRERERYVLAKMGTVGDFFAYRLRPAAELTERTDELDHFVCQPCFDAGKKGVLRLGEFAAVCPLCDSSIALKVRRTRLA